MIKTFKQFFAEQTQETIAVLPGGFKPPTKGHFNALQYLLQDADKGIVFIGNQERDSITPDQALKIWQVYSKYTNKPIKVAISEISPVTSVYKFADDNKQAKIIVGAGSKNEDIKRYNYFEKNIEKYPLVQIVKIPIQSEGISGTLTRNKISANIDDAIEYFVPDVIKDNFKDVDLIKQILLNK